MLVHREDDFDILEPRRVLVVLEPAAGQGGAGAFGGGLREAEIDQPVLGKLRMQLDMEQAALARIGIAHIAVGVRHAFDGRGQLAVARADAQIAGITLRHQEAPVRKQREAPGVIDTGRNRLHAYPDLLGIDKLLILRR